MQDLQSKNSGISARFTVTQRLLRKQGFDHVMRAEKISDECFSVFFARNDGKIARLGIVASKRILSAAVARNRFKRMVREMFRQHKISVQNLDLVVLVKSAYVREINRSGGKLRILFNRVEDRCTEH